MVMIFTPMFLVSALTGILIWVHHHWQMDIMARASILTALELQCESGRESLAQVHPLTANMSHLNACHLPAQSIKTCCWSLDEEKSPKGKAVCAKSVSQNTAESVRDQSGRPLDVRPFSNSRCSSVSLHTQAGRRSA